MESNTTDSRWSTNFTLKIVQERLWQASITMTLHIRRHMAPGLQKAADAGFDRRVLPSQLRVLLNPLPLSYPILFTLNMRLQVYEMVDLKCPECNCTIPPDATRCPNCSHKYDDVIAKAPAKNNGNG